MANAYRTDANGKVIYQEGERAYVPPVVAAPTPPGQSASNSDFWRVNPARPTNLAALVAGTYNTPIDQGSDGIRGQAENLKNTGNETDKMTVDPRDSATLSGLLTNLQNSANSVKTQTDADIKYIDEQANAAGEEYNDLIRQAQDEKRSGMAKNLVAAGERGGLLSSQYVGQAAQAPTEGGTFVGEGGDLAKRRDVYSLNISKLEGLKTQAIAAAKAAAAKFIKDGKQADYQIAKDLYDVAKGVVQDSLDLQYKNKQLDLQYNQEKRADNLAKLQNSEFEFEKTKYQYELEHPAVKTNTKDVMGSDGQMHSILYNETTGATIQDLGVSESLVMAILKKYPDAGILPTDTLTIAENKFKTNSKIYKDQVRGLVGAATTDSYFSRPKADGSIGYYYGNPKKPTDAQELTSENFLAGVSKAEGVIGDQKTEENVNFYTDQIEAGNATYIKTTPADKSASGKVEYSVIWSAVPSNLRDEVQKQVEQRQKQAAASAPSSKNESWWNSDWIGAIPGVN